MKASTLLSAAVMMSAICSAQATYEINDTFNNGGSGYAIPDGNPAGIAISHTYSGLSGPIDDVSVTLNISGGFNGDLVGYLVYQPTGGGSPITSMLLNRPGLGSGTGAQVYFGYSTSGMNVTLDDYTSQANINTTQSPVNGNTYNSSGGTLNSAFNGLTGTGTWTLYFADMSPGGGTSTLNSFILSVDAVPEPVTWAAVIFGAILLTAGGAKHVRASKRTQKA